MVEGDTSCCIAITKLMPAALKRLTPNSPTMRSSQTLWMPSLTLFRMFIPDSSGAPFPFTIDHL